jgi:prepilin-type N-terminal cleavage/methylation domain-containing protein
MKGRINTNNAARLAPKGFTLIELLVVIAIIALLLSILMPSLQMAKKKAATVVCLVNTKNLSLAWYMYAQDNDNKIVAGNMENAGTEKDCLTGWIGQPHTATDTTSSSLVISQTSPVTDDDEIRGVKKGKLYSYLQSKGVYHCIADKDRKGPDGTRLYVSYSIPRCLYGYSDAFKQQIRKITKIRSPSEKYNFVENGERSRGNWIMGGSFVIAAPEYGFPEYGLWSPIAISHGDSSIFSFTDGHSEVKKWHDSAVFEHYKKTEGSPPGSNYGQLFDPDSEDIQWLGRGWPYRP